VVVEDFGLESREVRVGSGLEDLDRDTVRAWNGPTATGGKVGR